MQQIKGKKKLILQSYTEQTVQHTIIHTEIDICTRHEL